MMPARKPPHFRSTLIPGLALATQRGLLATLQVHTMILPLSSQTIVAAIAAA
jgi:hypothetical protein